MTQTGDIGLVRVAGAVGSLIRVGQYLNGDGFATYEHAFMYVGNGEIVEAQPGGAIITDSFKYHDVDVRWLPCPAELAIDVAQAGRRYEGVPYSFLDYAALATHRLHIPAPGLKRYIETTKHMICSQLVDAAAANAGWHLFADGRWPGYVTPGALNHLWRRQNPHYID